MGWFVKSLPFQSFKAIDTLIYHCLSPWFLLWLWEKEPWRESRREWESFHQIGSPIASNTMVMSSSAGENELDCKICCKVCSVSTTQKGSWMTGPPSSIWTNIGVGASHPQAPPLPVKGILIQRSPHTTKGVGNILFRPITRILCGGDANEAKVDQTTEMYFLLSDSFI